MLVVPNGVRDLLFVPHRCAGANGSTMCDGYAAL
jgi:hypothetical protein